MEFRHRSIVRDLGVWWKWMVYFTHGLLYPWKQRPR